LFVDGLQLNTDKNTQSALKTKVAFHIHEALQAEFMQKRIRSLSKIANEEEEEEEKK